MLVLNIKSRGIDYGWWVLWLMVSILIGLGVIVFINVNVVMVI